MSLTTEIQQFQDEAREGWMPEKKVDPAAEIQAMRGVISACMSAMPVGNIQTHTPENLAARIGDLAAALAAETSENEAMREAIKDAHYALAYVYNHGAGSCAFPFRTEDDLCSENRFHHVKDALDALKPFIKP